MARRVMSDMWLGYVRVSTEEQANSGAGLADQEQRIVAWADGRPLAVVSDAGWSAKSLERPGMAECLARLEAREACGLVVAKLDRLSRSLLDFSTLMDRSRRKGWSLVALDLGVDTSTPAGEMMANVLATFAQFERRLISERTKAALAVKKAEGVKIGRPRLIPDGVRRVICELRGEGVSQAGIADALNAERVPTVAGGVKWYPSTVARVLAQMAVV